MKLVTDSLFKTALAAIAVLFLPVIVTFIYSYRVNEAFLRDNSLNAITFIAEAYEGQVYQFIEQSQRRAQDFASDGLNVSLLKKLEAGDRAAARLLSAHLVKNKLVLDRTIDRIYVLDRRGRVAAATNDVGIGMDASAKPFFLEGSRGISIVELRKPSGESELAVAAPIIDNSTGKFHGVLVNFIEFTEVSNIFSGNLSKELGAVSWQKGRHKTMEIYLVNKDMLMVSNSAAADGKFSSQMVDTDAVKSCITRQEEISGFYMGYRRTPVAGASMCMKKMHWTLIVEVAEAEVLESLAPMKRSAAAAAVIILLIVAALFFIFYKGVVERLLALGKAAGRVAQGEYDIVVPVKTYDEIGVLATEFNRMTAEVRRRDVLISQSEERLRTVIDNSTAIIYLKGLDGRYKLINKQYERIFNIASEMAAGMTDYDIFSLEQASAMRANDMWVIAARQPKEFEEVITQSDGIHYYVSVKVPVFDAIGAPYAVCGISTDITERKVMEDELRLLQAVSQTLTASMVFADALALTAARVCELTGWACCEVWVPNSADTTLVYSTGCVTKPVSTCKVDKLSRGITFQPGIGLPGRVWSTKKLEWVKDLSVNGDVFPRAAQMLGEGLHSGVGVPVVSDGRVLAVIVFFMFEAGGRDEHYIKILSAISNQLGVIVGSRLVEERHREAMRRYEELVNNLSVGVYRHTHGPDGRFVEVNRAMTEMLGAGSRDEMLRRGLAELCKDKARCRELDDELMKKGFVNGAEIEFVTFNDRQLWVSMTVVKREDKDGNIYFDGIMEDVSEKRLLEEQLRHSQKLDAVGQLAGGIAHDFNNMLTAINGYANLLRMKRGADEMVNSYAGHILTLTDKATTLTQGLLSFSRKRPMILAPVDLNELVAGISDMFKRLIGEDIEFRTSLVPGELVVMGDADQIEQVLMNLATNARDAMPSGGAITITTSVVNVDTEFVSRHGYGSEGTFALITFEDTGTGMDDATREHLFEPFFTTKEVGKGTGLGLATAYGTIKQHNGYINVYSEPGAGTVFRVYLPVIVDREGKAAVSAKKSDVMGGAETLLLVEDDANVRETTKKILEEFGYRVIEASNGEEAVAIYKQDGGAIDMVILDMIMPKKGGRETYEEMKRLRPDVRALFMSGYSEEVVRSRGAGDWNFDFISKPAAPAELMRKIREVLDK